MVTSLHAVSAGQYLVHNNYVGLDPKLSVQSDNLRGSLVEFYVNGVKADQTANFQNDHPEEVNLRIEDLVEPTITDLSPALDETVGVATPTISADYSDALSGIDIATAAG